MSRADLVGHLMEWLLAGPLPPEVSEHNSDEPPADVPSDPPDPIDRD